MGFGWGIGDSPATAIRTEIKLRLSSPDVEHYGEQVAENRLEALFDHCIRPELGTINYGLRSFLATIVQD
jgi:hypothetical protein